MRRKVFGIGFHKTGTTSLAKALVHLGYRVTGPNRLPEAVRRNFARGLGNVTIDKHVREMVFDLADKFDAFQDNPWPVLYKELDEKFPASKFILTVRPTQDWIRSVVNQFNDEETPMRQWIYGVARPKGNEDVYISRYERHNREVMEHFKDRPHQLLILDITAGEGWEKLCPFLGKPIPATPFPYANTAPEVKRDEKRNKSCLWRTYFKVIRRVKGLIMGSRTAVRS
jgi:hypothetical protein